MMNQINIVKTKIQKAFATTPYPGDDNLVVDQSGNDPECSEIADAFLGKDWRDISSEMVRKYSDSLPLLTPSAFRYYLPAYMIACVDAYNDLSIVVDNLIFNLSPPKEAIEWAREFFLERIKLFTNDERQGIKSFLDLIAEYERTEWSSQRLEPPIDRARPALDYWIELTGGSPL